MQESIKYQAYGSQGQKVASTFQGSFDEFKQYLKKRKLVLIEYKILNEELKEGTFKAKDFIYFIEELLYLTVSGMGIDKSLLNISKNATFKVQKNFYDSILHSLKEGNQFSFALKTAAQKYKIDVDELSLVLLETNESVGNLSLGLKKVKEHLEFKEKIASEIKQALSYPLFLIVMSISMIFFVFLIIVPKFSTIFTPEEYQNLPFVSKLVLDTGLFVDSNIAIIMTVLAALLFCAYLFYAQVKLFIYNTLMQIKIFKDLNLKLQLSYFFASLSLMLEGGLDLKKALTQSKKIITYSPLKALIDNAIIELKQGIHLSESFRNSSLIDANTVSLINAGENSGDVTHIFSSLSSRFSSEFNKSVKAFLSILEPLVIVFMGMVIAVIIISIMLAVMSITDIAG
jgi:type II secretory pathway component PulF